MISYLKGKIKTINENNIILLCSSVGYKVYLNRSILLGLSEEDECEVFTHQSFSEYGSSLFGFQSEDGIGLFEKLIQVSGVGPKLAMGIMESPIDTLKHALLNKDTALLTELPGIGKKTAERLCMELSSKIGSVGIKNIEPEHSPSQKLGSHSTPLSNEDAFMALQSLGFSRLEAHRMIATVPATIFDTEEIVKIALKNKS